MTEATALVVPEVLEDGFVFSMADYGEVYQKLNQDTHHFTKGEVVDGVQMFVVEANEVVDTTESELRERLEVIKQKLEQVELFGMERDDYEELQAEAITIVEKLTEIDAAKEVD